MLFSYPNLYQKIDQHSGAPCKSNGIEDVENEALPAQNDLDRTEIGDLRRRSGDHKGGCAAHAHPIRQPLDQQRDRSPSAHIDRDADSRSHQDTETVILSEKSADKIFRNMDLIQGSQEDPQQKHGSGRFDVAPDIQQKTDQQIGMGIPVGVFMEAGEIEERLPFPAVKEADQQSCRTTAKKTAQQTDDQRGLSQCGRVKQQLRVEQDAGHHKRRKVIIPHALFRKGGCERDRSVHTQRRGHAKKAGGDHPKPAYFLLSDLRECAVNKAFPEYRDCTSQRDAQRPIGCDLPDLDIQVIPEVDDFPLDPVCHSITASL